MMVNTAVHENASGEDIEKPLVVRLPGSNEYREVKLFKRKSRRKAIIKLQARSNYVEFEATNASTSTSLTPYKLLLGKIDESSGLVSIWEPDILVGESTLLRQNQCIGDRNKSKVESEESVNQSYLQSKALLGHAFGTKRTKKMLQSVEKNKVDVEHISGQTNYLVRTIGSIAQKINERDAADEKERAGTYDAKNANALQPQSLNFYDLIPITVYEAIEVEELVKISRNKNIDISSLAKTYSLEGVLTGYLTRILSDPNEMDDKTLERKIKCIMYLNLLLHYRSLSEIQINKKLGSLLNVTSETIVQHLRDTFAEKIPSKDGKPKYILSTMAKDRLVTHICILVLMIDDFRADTAELSGVLKISHQKTMGYLKALGCTFQGASRSIVPKGKNVGKFAVLANPPVVEYNH